MESPSPETEPGAAQTVNPSDGAATARRGDDAGGPAPDATTRRSDHARMPTAAARTVSALDRIGAAVAESCDLLANYVPEASAEQQRLAGQALIPNTPWEGTPEVGADTVAAADPSIEAGADTIDAEFAAILAETFATELEELLDPVPKLLEALADPARQPAACADLGRIFHTIKGSAATVGRTDLERCGKAVQDVLEELEDEAFPLEPAIVERAADEIRRVYQAAGREAPADALALALDAARASMHDDDAPDPASADAALAEILAAGSAASADPTGSLPAGEDAAPSIQPSHSALDTASAKPAAGPAAQNSTVEPAGPTAIEPELMEAFALDADAALEGIEEALLMLERAPTDHAPLRLLFRQFHTLKGAAASVGLEPLAAQLHGGESLLEDIIERRFSVAAEPLLACLLELGESVAGLVAESRGVAHSSRILDDITPRISGLLAPVSPARASVREAPATVPAPAIIDDAPAAAPLPHRGDDSAVVRVHASRLDQLMNRVSELVVSRTRLEDGMAACRDLGDRLAQGRLRLRDAIEGLRSFEFPEGPPARAIPPATEEPGAPARAGQPRRAGTPARVASLTDFTDLEFDKYDDLGVLTRSLVELTNDAAEMVEQIGEILVGLGEESRQISKVTSGLQRTVTSMRLVSLDALFRRLERATREAARLEGREARLVCHGGETQLDRGLVEALAGPLLHLVRNAVSHGIESPSLRQSRGKSRLGTVEIAATPRDGAIEVTVRDDGGGLDLDAIHTKAVRSGRVAASAVLSRSQIARFIFAAGLSTRDTVGAVAGRGVGLDVVAAEVERLRGSIALDCVAGQGTVFVIRVPLLTAIDQVFLLRSGERLFAVPLSSVETMVQFDPGQLDSKDGVDRLRLGATTVPALPLADVCGDPETGLGNTAAVLRTGDEKIAVLFDRVEGQREAVMRPLGPLLAAHTWISGATFSGDGRVLFCLDAAGLLRLSREGRSRPASPSRVTAPAGPSADVLWVDDSISVRKLAVHFLRAAGCSVDTAVDGLDALEKLRCGRYRMLITDLEMPRMHGYELLALVRADPRLAALPVVVCSSRGSTKHRERAARAGASDYLVKPFGAEGLARLLQEYLPAR